MVGQQVQARERTDPAVVDDPAALIELAWWGLSSIGPAVPAVRHTDPAIVKAAVLEAIGFFGSVELQSTPAAAPVSRWFAMLSARSCRTLVAKSLIWSVRWSNGLMPDASVPSSTRPNRREWMSCGATGACAKAERARRPASAGRRLCAYPSQTARATRSVRVRRWRSHSCRHPAVVVRSVDSLSEAGSDARSGA